MLGRVEGGLGGKQRVLVRLKAEIWVSWRRRTAEDTEDSERRISVVMIWRI